MVTSWLRNSVVSQISSSLMYIDDASSIWSDLKQRFSQGDLARIYQLRQQLMNLTQGHLDVNTYYTNLRILWDELRNFQPHSWCSCGTCRCESAKKWSDFQEQEYAMQFLIGLNSSFAQIRSQILSSVPLAPISNIFSLAIQGERQHSIDGGLTSSFTPQVSEQSSPIINAAIGSSRGRDKFLCTHCGKTNHTVDKCFQLHGFPPGFGRGRGKPMGRYDANNTRSVNLVEEGVAEQDTSRSTLQKISSYQYQQLINLLQNQLAQQQSSATTLPPSTLIASSSSNPNFQTQSPAFSGNISIPTFVGTSIMSADSWLIDTGATHHICCNSSLFTSHIEPIHIQVNLPNGNFVTATHKGHIKLSQSLTLCSVLFVPNFTYNLLSVSSLT